MDADTIETGEQAREALVRQVSTAVHWEESVRLLIEEGVNTFVEVGPGKVLTGLAASDRALSSDVERGR